MNNFNNTQPPKWPLKCLRYFVRQNYLEEIEGDMEEIFQDNVEQFSYRQAKKMYVKDTFLLLRPLLIKTQSSPHHIIVFSMLKNYFKTSLRSLQKYSLFSGINVIGLGISMCVGLLMILVISELQAFDDFHPDHENMYRVTSTRTLYGREGNYTTASFFIGNQIKAKAPGVEKVLILGNQMSADLKTSKNALPVKGFYAPASFFDFFAFKLIKGNPATALLHPNNIVLTETTAKKLFGDEDPVGQTVTAERNSDFQDGIITGVMQDLPINSHIQFEALTALKTLDQRNNNQEKDFKADPRQMYASIIYLVLNQHTLPSKVEEAMSTFMEDYNADVDAPITHLLQPLASCFTSDTFMNGTGPYFSNRKLLIMIGLTIIVLLSACFNYTNLSMARALRRSKEIGVRKVTGATRFQVFTQFMIEAVLLSFIALCIGIVLFFFIKSAFLNLPNPGARGYQIFTLDISLSQILYFLLFAIAVGILAGFLPALFLSKLKAKTIFSDASKIKLFSGIDFRRLLIVFQFTMSIGLIMCAVFVHKQYKFALNYDLGFNTEQIVNVSLKGNYAQLLENEYSKLSAVAATSKSSVELGVGSARLTMLESEDKSAKISLLSSQVDENYFSMHQFKMLAGTGFKTPLGKDEGEKYVVVNEALLKGLNLGTPQEAIGKYVWSRDTKLQILGVVEDFVSISLNLNLEDAFGFYQTNQPRYYNTLGVKIQSNDLMAIMDNLEESYKSIDPVHPFKATFYDDKIAQTYHTEKTAYTIFSFLAFLAISISSLGLLGMAVFTTESRMKEVSIRKVLGARNRELMFLLSKGFLLMMIIAGMLAIPSSIYVVNNMILDEFIHKPEFSLLEMLSGLIIVLCIGLMTIGWQTQKAAVQNPADTLRNE